MASLEEVGIHLTAKDDQSPKVHRAGEELDRYKRKANDADDGSRRMARGAGDLTAGLGSLHSGLTRVSASLGDFTVRQVQRATIGLVGMTTAAVALGLRSASSFEQYDVAFGTMLDSTERGKQMMDDLAAFNLKTPFDLPGLANATQQMLLYGYAAGSALSTVKTVSDVAASSGPRMQESLGRMTLALGQIKAKGVLQGEEIRQLTEAGFPAYQLLTEISGKTAAQLRKDMERGLDPALAEQFLAAVESGQAETFQRFRGGAEAQSKTLLGIWSNLKDNVNRKLADETSPLGARLAEGMPAFQASLDRLITTGLPPVIDLLGDAVDAAPGFLTAATPVLRDMIEFGTELVPVLGELTGAASHLLPIAGDMLDVFGDFLDLEYGHEAAAAMLGVLLGYRALHATAKAVTTFATALDILTGAQTRNAAAGGVTGAVGRGRGAGLLTAGRRLTAAGGLTAFGVAGVQGYLAANSAEWSDDRSNIEYNQRKAGEHGALSGVNSWLKSSISAGIGDWPVVGAPIRKAIGAEKDGRFLPDTMAASLIRGAPATGGPVDNRVYATIDARGASTNVDVAKAVEDGIRAAQQDTARRAGKP